MPDLRNSNLTRIMDGKHVTKSFDSLRWTADAAAGISRGLQAAFLVFLLAVIAKKIQLNKSDVPQEQKNATERENSGQ